jgi:hypothetical protein
VYDLDFFDIDFAHFGVFVLVGFLIVFDEGCGVLGEAMLFVEE